MAGRRRKNETTVGQWRFIKIDGRQISESYEGQCLYGYCSADDPYTIRPVTVWYDSLQYAMAAAIAEKHTGPRGAGGTGVGTAADWFMRMIGAVSDAKVDAR